MTLQVGRGVAQTSKYRHMGEGLAKSSFGLQKFYMMRHMGRGGLKLLKKTVIYLNVPLASSFQLIYITSKENFEKQKD